MSIDPSAMHNFIDEEFVKKKVLKEKQFKGFHVNNTNGKLTLVDNIAERFGFKIQEYVARQEFYVYPLDGIPHLILGVRWLFDLGDIHTKYQNLVMSFEVEGRNTPSTESRIIFPKFIQQVRGDALEGKRWHGESLPRETLGLQEPQLQHYT